MKLSKVGYSAHRPRKLGRVPDRNDYPRWGYLDKFENNVVMPKAFCVAAALFLGGVGAWSGWTALRVWRLRNQVQDLSQATTRTVKVLTAADIGVPPSLMQTLVTAVKIEVKPAAKIAMPIPVPDDQAEEETIATVDEISVANVKPIDLGFGTGTGDSLVFDAGDIALPSPDQYVPFETAPRLIVNAGAYTAVDRAESEPDLAQAVNGTAPRILAEETKRLGAALVHYSTDYVFDGGATHP